MRLIPFKHDINPWMKDDEYEEDEIAKVINNMGVTEKAEGVKSSVVKTEITFEDYVECL